MRRECFKKLSAAALSMLLALVLLAQPIMSAAEPVADAIASSINHAPCAPYGLLTNESEHPMNVEGAPMFDWWVMDEDYDEVQTAYQIRLYDGVTDALVWDSGKVLSAQQNCVPYTGGALNPGYPYSWEVRTWDRADEVSPYSARAEFSTGLGNDNWDAYWIQGMQNDVESPLSIVEEEVEDVILQGEGFALQRDYTDWDDYEVSAKLTLIMGSVGVAFRTSIDGQTGYVWQLVPGVGLVRNKVVNGELTRLGDPVSLEVDVVPGKAYTLSVRAEGSTVTTTLDGAVIDEYTAADISKGTFGFYTAKGEKTRLHSLTVAETGGDKILGFNRTINNSEYKGGAEWTDYTIEFDMVITEVAAGVMIRTSNEGKSGYMWQFNLTKNSGNGGLARHIRTNNQFSKIDGSGAVACTLEQGKTHHVAITVSGNVITTYLDGQHIDTYTDTNSTHMSGSFGMRQGGGETASLSNITVTAPDGTVLCREESEDNSNYVNGNYITVTEAAAGGYTTEFSATDLGSWVGTEGSLPIKSGTQTVYWAESSGDGVTLLNYGLDWTDYTISLDVQAIATSAGIVFRAPDASNSGYMWAVRSDGILRLHKGENNKYARLTGKTSGSDFSMGFVAGKTYHLTIVASDNTIKTYVDGVLKNTATSDVSFAGSIGFRTDRNECGRYTNVVVTDPDGNILYSDDFSNGPVNWGTSGALNADNSYWYSRKEVALAADKEVKRAVAYVSGSQDYELSVNGVRIGRAQTYDYPGETRYQGWDITDAVKGQDAAAIGVLTSYFGGAQGRAVSKPGLLGKFVIYYTDGTSQTVVTDETWLTHATGYSNLGARNGEGDEIEYCDARLMLSGWTEVGYDTTDWANVIVHGAHPTTTFYNLIPEVGHVAETRVSAVSVTRLEDGTTVADFGKIIPARIMIHFPDGVAGTEITVQEGYQLKADGTINTSTDSTQSTNMTYVYTMKDGEQTFEAWGYLGFRYVSVPASAGVLTAADFEATVLHAEIVSGRQSTLTTSDEMLNQVFELMQRSALYSVQNQFVDTPTREKGQFLYDAINISAATMTGSYERQMTRKAILQFLASSDRHWTDENEIGMYTAVYPNNDGARDIPEFTLNVPRLVWRYYMLTGDRELLEYAYPYMKNTAGYVTRNINSETGLVTAIYGGGTSSSYKQGIIDTPPDRFGYDWSGTLDGVRTTINAHCVRVYDIVADMSEELGYTEDAALYNAKADALRSAMNEYLITEDGVFCDGLTPDGTQSSNTSQHATSHAIVAGTSSDEELDVMLDYIASLGMRQGTTTADILLEALFANGRGDAAVRLLTNPNDYGWAKVISRGGTFIWENWHGSGSQSHGWGAASMWQVIEYISGVKVMEAGAKTIRIDPAEGSVDEVSSHTVTARGAVDISYSGSGRDYVITIEIPANMTAEVVFPIIEGGEFVEIGGHNGTNEFTEDGQIMTVGSGKRSFRYVEHTVEHNYVPVITPPTCTERGYTTYTCSDCGDTYEIDFVDALGHSYGEWSVTTEPTCSAEGVKTRECSVCGEDETEAIPTLAHTTNSYGYCSVCQIKITGASVRIGDDLSIKYYVNLIDESILNGGSLVMEFVMNGEVVSTVTEYKLEGGRYTFLFEGITPQQMVDEITATVKVERGGAYTSLAQKANYSIKDNCVSLLAKSAADLGISDEKYAAMRILISDLLAYGDAAQDYKGYTDSGYATDGVDGLTPSVTAPTDDDRMLLTGSDNSLRFKSASVEFDTVNRIYIKLIANVADTALVTVKVNGVSYSLTDLVTVGGGVYKITTGAISATDFDEAIFVELVYDGVTVGTLTYSINAYAYALHGNASASAQMRSLALALYRYGRSAEAYAAING